MSQKRRHNEKQHLKNINIHDLHKSYHLRHSHDKPHDHSHSHESEPHSNQKPTADIELDPKEDKKCKVLQRLIQEGFNSHILKNKTSSMYQYTAIITKNKITYINKDQQEYVYDVSSQQLHLNNTKRNDKKKMFFEKFNLILNDLCHDKVEEFRSEKEITSDMM